MCKILILTNASKIKNLKKAVSVIGAAVTKTEVDGFGYTIQGQNGLFGERTLNTNNIKMRHAANFGPVPSFGLRHRDQFGVKSEVTGAALFHGRTSTNNVSLINTHPINKHDWSLIHNGVVTNHGPAYSKLTTNDSEDCLHYLANSGIEGLAKNLTGYYALGAIDPIGQLHIIRDNTAQLSFAWSPTIESYIFATTEGIIESVAKSMDWSLDEVFEFQHSTHLVMRGNEVLSQNQFSPRGYESRESRFASASLGRDLGTYDKSTEFNWSSLESTIYDQYNSDLYNEDEALFLKEVNSHADASYSFFDARKQPLTLEEFQSLEDNEKLYCTVVRSDGTIVSPDDYESEKLFEGAS